MDEAAWLSAVHPEVLLWTREFTEEDRKRRLFECACCRRVWHLLPDERSRRAILAAEGFVEGLIDAAAREEAANLASEVEHEERQQEVPGSFWSMEDMPLPYSSTAYNVALPNGWWGAAPAFESPSRIIRERGGTLADEPFAQCALIRDIFGNPFRPVAIEPAWQTEAVVGIARGIYEDRAFERMPILADALQDAGCENADILTHCREPGVHVRGCWVVDLVLGKS